MLRRMKIKNRRKKEVNFIPSLVEETLKEALDRWEPPAGITTLREWQAYFLEQAMQGKTVISPDLRNALPRWRPLNSNMVRFAIEVAHKAACRSDWWVRFDECAWSGRDYNYTQKWHLTRMKPSDKSKEPSKGLWAPTSLLLRIIARPTEILLPEKLLLWNNKVVGESSERIHIGQVREFNYEEFIQQLENAA